MKDIMLYEADWGCIDIGITPQKLDLLPRLTISDMTGAFMK